VQREVGRSHYPGRGIAGAVTRVPSSAMTIRVLTVDDHAVVRAGLAAMIANETDMVVVAEAVDGVDAVALYAEHHPDVVLMDIRMPRLDGVEATRAIRTAAPDARIVALTMYEGDADIHRALSAGASAYLLKGVPAADGGPTGDLLVTVEVAVPAELSAEERQAVEALATASSAAGSSPRAHLTFDQGG